MSHPRRQERPGPLCLSCANLDHLVYLPAGDARVRHRDTDSDALLMSGLDRVRARFAVRGEVAAVLEAWRAS